MTEEVSGPFLEHELWGGGMHFGSGVCCLSLTKASFLVEEEQTGGMKGWSQQDVRSPVIPLSCSRPRQAHGTDVAPAFSRLKLFNKQLFLLIFWISL